MDTTSHRLANALVGNSEDAATLEMTLLGDSIEVPEPALMALTGGEMEGTITHRTGEIREFPGGRPVFVPAESIVHFGSVRSGARAWLAIAGGIDVPELMGSRSTLVSLKLGGFRGRPTRNGDQLPVGILTARNTEIMLRLTGTAGDHERAAAPPWFSRLVAPGRLAPARLRIIPGSHWDCAGIDGQRLLLTEPLTVSPASDRMGYRLDARIPIVSHIAELLSAGTCCGMIQLPPDGRPILLMAECAPTGGYPCLAHVIAADLPLAAQCRPGQSVQLELTSFEEAMQLLRNQNQNLRRAIQMIRQMI